MTVVLRTLLSQFARCNNFQFEIAIQKVLMSENSKRFNFRIENSEFSIEASKVYVNKHLALFMFL